MHCHKRCLSGRPSSSVQTLESTPEAHSPDRRHIRRWEHRPQARQAWSGCAVQFCQSSQPDFVAASAKFSIECELPARTLQVELQIQIQRRHQRLLRAANGPLSVASEEAQEGCCCCCERMYVGHHSHGSRPIKGLMHSHCRRGRAPRALCGASRPRRRCTATDGRRSAFPSGEGAAQANGTADKQGVCLLPGACLQRKSAQRQLLTGLTQARRDWIYQRRRRGPN